MVKAVPRLCRGGSRNKDRYSPLEDACREEQSANIVWCTAKPLNQKRVNGGPTADRNHIVFKTLESSFLKVCRAVVVLLSSPLPWRCVKPLLPQPFWG